MITKEMVRAVADRLYDINEHVETLYVLTKMCLLHNKKGVVVELGTGNMANSTVPILRACQEMNATLVTTDVGYTVHPAVDGEPNLIKRNDESVKMGLDWDEEVDMIFLDTSHTFEQTEKEIEVWMPFLKINGMFIFHDTNLSWSGVYTAINNYLKGKENYIFYNFTNNNGLGIILKVK